MMHEKVQGLVALAFTLIQIGCSLAVDSGREQCRQDSDCAARGDAFASSVCVSSLCEPNPAWACTLSPTTPAAQKAMTTTLSLYDIASNAPVVGARVELCNKGDFNCVNPFNSVATDAQGNASVGVPSNFTGYVALQAEAYNPTLLFPTWPLEESDTLGNVPVAPAGAENFLSAQLGVPIITGRGLVFIQVQDCEGQWAKGATLDFAGTMTGAQPYYAFGGLPSAATTAVDDSGQAGVINAVPGILGIEAKMNGRAVGQASILVRDGYISIVRIIPGIVPTGGSLN